MEDFSLEDFQSFARSYVDNNVIQNNERLLHFYQDDKCVVLQGERNKCTFYKSGDIYKMKYVESAECKWIAYKMMISKMHLK